MRIENSYLIFKSDFKNRNWLDWIICHVTGAPPPFRFKGAVRFDATGLRFSGYDIYNSEEVNFTIPKGAFTQLYYGFDNTFYRAQTRNFGVGREPIRFTYISPENETEVQLYLVADFNGLYSKNEQLFEELKNWVA